jgi:hypothetical protein
MDAETRAVARQNRNTLATSLLGYVWVRFLSPRNCPIGGISCILLVENREWAEKKTTADGEVCWDHVPLFELTVRLTLGGRNLEVPVPWLRDTEEIHIERLYDAETKQIMGPSDCPYSIQVRLNGLGYECGIVDGDIGPKTKEATRAFQEDRGLVVDGIPGPATQSYLIQAFDGTETENDPVEVILDHDEEPWEPPPS